MSLYVIGQIVNFIFFLSPWASIYLLYRFLKTYESRIRTDEELHRKLDEIHKQVSEIKEHLNYKL
jgi:biopolymer transport protein ExbB/TolQ